MMALGGRVRGLVGQIRLDNRHEVVDGAEEDVLVRRVDEMSELLDKHRVERVGEVLLDRLGELDHLAELCGVGEVVEFTVIVDFFGDLFVHAAAADVSSGANTLGQRGLHEQLNRY